MRYIYRDTKKDIFIDGYKYADVVKDWKIFLKIISDLELYLVKFDLEKNIKDKIYPNNYQVVDINHWLIIIITYNEWIFSVKDRKTHGW